MATLLPEGKQSFTNGAGAPLVGGKVYTYDAGTSTPRVTYQDSAGTVPNTNPIILDARGEATVFWSGAYKVVLKDAADVTIWTVDGVVVSDATNLGVSDGSAGSVFTTLQGFITKILSSVGSSIVGFIQNGTSPVVRTAQAKMRDTVHANDFGADKTGTVDSYAALQNAINLVASQGGGCVLLDPGLYLLSAGLVTNTGVVLQGTVRTDTSSNTNGGGSSSAKPTILWSGGVGGYMFTVKPSTVGDCVWGGGSVDVEWNGNDRAAVGVHLDNTKYAVFDGKVRQVTFGGVRVSSTSGSVSNFSMKNHIRSLEFVWGTVAACQNAHGLVLDGNGTTVPSTQQLVGDVSGLVYNGYLVRISETDNAQFGSVHAAVQSPGSGGAAYLVNAGAQGSSHNVFTYVVGKVFEDGGLIGNTFLQYNSEGGGISAAGSPSWDGELVDYITGRRYKSHTYKLRDWVAFRPGDFIGDAASATIDAALQWRTLSLPNVGSPRAGAIAANDYTLPNGVIDQLEFYYTTNGTAGGNLRMVFAFSTIPLGSAGPLITPEFSFTVTIPQAAQYAISRYVVNPISPSISMAQKDTIALSVQRLSVDALDTATDEVQLLGVRLRFTASGPDSSGSGTYYIPAWD